MENSHRGGAAATGLDPTAECVAAMLEISGLLSQQDSASIVATLLPGQVERQGNCDKREGTYAHGSDGHGGEGAQPGCIPL